MGRVWLVKAPPLVGENVTGDLFGHKFAGGVALVTEQYWYRFFTGLGYKDVSPDWFKELDTGDPERILCIRWGGIGDVLMATAAIKAYKEKHPKVELHLATDIHRFELLKHNPYIDHFMNCSKHQLGHYVDQFDASYDFSGIIAGNALSEIVNTYELYEEWLGVPIEDKVPDLHIPVVVEDMFRKRLEADWGIASEDALIVIQTDTSTAVRNWPLRYTRELAMLLTRKYPDKYICLVGLNDDVRKRRWFQCEACRKWDTVIMLGKLPKDPFESACAFCNAPIRFTKKKISRRRTKSTAQYVNIAEPDNIKYFINRLGLLEIACLCKQAELVIGPDSGLLHIAASVDTPCLGIFASFDASLRLGTYPKAYWLQRDYYCAPCFLHHTGCPNSKRVRGTDDPLCMEEITAGQVFSASVAILQETYERGCDLPLRSSFVKPDAQNSISTCPVCYCSLNSFLCRKGRFGYYRCEKCGTIVCDPTPNMKEQHRLYGRRTKYLNIYKNEAYVEACKRSARSLSQRFAPYFWYNGNVFEIGCNIGTVLAEMKRLGWDVTGIDVSKDAIREAKHHWDLKQEVAVADFEQYDFGEKKYDLIICHQTLEHFADPKKVLKRMLDGLSPVGAISVVSPDADACDLRSPGKWGHLNTLFAGEHLCIVGEAGMKQLAKDCGLVVIEYVKLKHSNDFSCLLCRKDTEERYSYKKG